jgi:hypothetical protein
MVQRQCRANGLDPAEITFTDEALHKIVRDYTREAPRAARRAGVSRRVCCTSCSVPSVGWTIDIARS